MVPLLHHGKVHSSINFLAKLQ